MATAAEIQEAVRISLRDNDPVKMADRAQRQVVDRWGDLIQQNCAQLPFGLVAVRIAHETSGNPRATSSQGERGLLQLFPSTQQNCGLPDEQVYDPALNMACGCSAWVKRGTDLRVKYPFLNSISGNDFWGLSNLTMSIGAGATGLLANRVQGGFSSIWRFLQNDPQAFADLPAGWWGTQASTLVARRIAATAQWLVAADMVQGASGGSSLFLLGVLGYAGYRLWKLYHK